MILYKIYGSTGFIEDWQGNQEDARGVQARLIKEFESDETSQCIIPKGRENIRIQKDDVPTDKQGLLEWLRRNIV